MGDAYVWRRLLVSFKSASTDLCDAVANVAYRLATEQLQALLNNRLIPLDKNPGIPAFDLWASVRCCAALPENRFYLLSRRTSCKQLESRRCALDNRPPGCEVAIYALRQLFESMATNGVLLVDADNAI